jgi:hypothetical protein
MVTDPPNRHYGAVLTALLQERNSSHRPTWIYTPNPIASATFQGMYGAAFAAVLETPELNLLQVTPTRGNGVRTRAALKVKAERPVPQLTTTCLKPSRAGQRNSLHRDKAKGAPKAKELCKRRQAPKRGFYGQPASPTHASEPEETRGIVLKLKGARGTTRVRHPADPQSPSRPSLYDKLIEYGEM